MLATSARAWRWGRATTGEKTAFAAFVAFVVGSLCLLVHPWYDLTIDGSIYLVTARSLAAGEGYRYVGEPFQVRPPGLPLLLVPFLSGLAQGFFPLNLFFGGIGALGVLLLFAFARARLGFWLALATALAVWLNPNYERLMTQVMSDVGGAALVLACLLLERWANARPSWRRELVLGLAIGLAAYFRMLVILLVPAIAISRLLRRSPPEPPGSLQSFVAARLLVFAAVAGLALAPWIVRNHLNPAPVPAEQTLLHSYGVANWHSDPGDPESPLLPPSAILARIPLRCLQFAYVLGSRMSDEILVTGEPEGGLSLARAAFALLLIGSSLVVLVKRREPAEIFVAIFLGVLAIYFSFVPRLLLPVFVLALPAAVECVRDLVARAANARAGSLAAAAGLAALIAIDFAPRRDWEAIEREHRELVAVCRAIEGRIGPDARIASVVGSHYSVFLERPVYNLQIVAWRARSFEAAERLIAEKSIDTIVLTNRTDLEQRFADYFQARYGEPERAGAAMIWHLPKPTPPAPA